MKRNKINQVVIQLILGVTIVSVDENEISTQFVEGETGIVSYNEDEVYTLHGMKHGSE